MVRLVCSSSNSFYAYLTLLSQRKIGRRKERRLNVQKRGSCAVHSDVHCEPTFDGIRRLADRRVDMWHSFWSIMGTIVVLDDSGRLESPVHSCYHSRIILFASHNSKILVVISNIFGIWYLMLHFRFIHFHSRFMRRCGGC